MSFRPWRSYTLPFDHESHNDALSVPQEAPGLDCQVCRRRLVSFRNEGVFGNALQAVPTTSFIGGYTKDRNGEVPRATYPLGDPFPVT